MAQNGKLSFVLPVTFGEKGVSLNGSHSWRHSPDEGAPVRTRLLLASFLKNFEQDDLGDFYVVCSADDMPALSALLASLTSDPRYRIVHELDVCPDIPKAINPDTGTVDGWFVQQLIKFSMAQYVSSSHYVTLDSDILCIRPFSYGSLVFDGLALTNIETVSDYERIYTADFSAREVAIKSDRYQRAAEMLGYRRPPASSLVFYGETPVVLQVQSVIALAEYLKERFLKPWSHTLATRLSWTEQALYYQFLEMTGRLTSVCNLTGCNGVLDLEKSVWQASARYRQPRVYDVDHFTRGRQDGAGGFFVAIQSWLPTASWLPPRCRELSDFYHEVEGWLLGRDGTN